MKLIAPLLFATLCVCSAIVAGMSNTACAANAQAPASPEGAPITRSHKTPKGFTNPLVTEQHGSLGAFLRARFRSGKWAKYDPDTYTVPTATPELVTPNSNDGSGASGARATWIGHSTVLIQHKGINVLTDPVFSQYASPVGFAGPKRITQPALTIDELPPIDIVVISHDHYDHLDTWSIKQLGNQPRYFVPLGIKDWMIGKGIDEARVTELDWWQSEKITLNDQPIEITATPTQHFSGRGLFDRNSTLWASWAVSLPDFTFWFGGDTGYNDTQFREIGKRIPNIDLGIIPIGAYAPQWFMGAIHVNPEEAVRIHQDIGARKSMGIHWGAFLLTAEEVNEPPRRLAEALAESNLLPGDFSALAVGETRRYF